MMNETRCKETHEEMDRNGDKIQLKLDWWLQKSGFCTFDREWKDLKQIQLTLFFEGYAREEIPPSWKTFEGYL